ncbi:MAG: hypothetical protein ACLSFB_01955 [[Clostridium] scindens]
MLVKADKKWDYALGMIKVDGLEPTPEMKQLIKKRKAGRDFHGRSEKGS